MEEELKQLTILYDRINEIEKKKKLNDQLTYDWVEELTDPEFQLIDNMSHMLNNLLTSLTHKERIIHIFRFFLISSNDNSVRQQLNEIAFLPQILSQYMMNSQKFQILQDSFYIIGKIFDVQTFKDVITLNFITNIFDKLASVEDDDVLLNAIDILLNINTIYTNINDSLFLNVYHQHCNSRLIDEILLRIFNNETNKEKMFKILLCLTNIIDKEEKIVFYSSDLETFIDIAISKLESTYSEEMKLYLIGLLKRITFYDEYYKGMFKISELTDLMEDYAANEDQSQNIRTNSQKVLDNLVKHLQEKLKDIEDEDEYEAN